MFSNMGAVVSPFSYVRVHKFVESRLIRNWLKFLYEWMRIGMIDYLAINFHRSCLDLTGYGYISSKAST